MARTLDQLAIIANQIKDATLQGENTADRVGGLLVDLIDFLRTINVDEIALSPLLTALNESGLVDPQDGQILKFSSTDDNWVFSSDIAQLTNTIRTITETLSHLDERFVKKSGDIMTGLLTTLAGIKVRNFLQIGDRFVSGLLGQGGVFRENIGGRTYLEADEIYIRVKAYFDTVEIRKFLHSGGNRIASLSGAKCIRVEMMNSNSEVVTEAPTKYRCYFRASDGDDTVTNDFVVGDQAYCHVTNATNDSLNMHHYWRLVIGKDEYPNENGEHWIDLSNQESETIDGIVYSGYLDISDAPAAQDDIIQLGNVNDSTRRGAIIEFVSGNDAPSYQIFQDLGSIGSATTIAQKHDAQYSYNNKNYISMGYSSSTGRAYLNVYGDFLFGDPEESTYVKYNAYTKQLDIKATVHFISPTTHQETTLDTFASAVTGGLESLQRQIDGEIDTWFYNGTPGPSVLPESEWVAIDTQTGTNNERLKHLGDLYYDNSTGYAYRYTNTGTEANPVFTWSQISDSAVIKALEDAAKAQDTADHKRRVFITSAGVLPTPPYSEGDIWMNVTYPANATATDAANNTYYNDILRCKVPATYNQQGELVREGVESGETALITHWQLSSKYTDDSKFNYFFTNTYSPFVTNIQQQVDKKAETWRQDNDPSLAQGWVPSEHVGDLWMDTNDNDQYGHKTFIYVDYGEGTNPRYGWEPQAVPDEVFDEIDGKAEIFVQKPTTYNERDMWIIESNLASTDMPTGCQSGDIVVADNMPSGTTKRENSYVKGDWRKKDRYTDDTKVDNLLNNTYVQQLIGGSINQAITSGDAAAVQQAAQAAQTTYGYLTQALSQDTQITGGLILSSMIALRDGNGNMRSGISGTYIDRTTPNPEDPDEPYALGHGIAAWYGGENIDHEAFPALTNYAKSLFRFDGTGYLASGNISWDTDGALTIQGATLRAVEGSSTIEITTAQIASINWVNSNFISKTWFNKFFVAHYKRNGTDYTLSPNNDFPQDATDKTLESVFSFWTNYGLTALGKGIDGTHVVGVLDDLNDVTISDPQTNQVLTYKNGIWVNDTAPSGASALSGLTDVAISSLADKDLLQWDYASGKWKNVVLSTAMSAYALASSIPTNVSQLNNDSGYVTSSGVTSVDTGTGLTGGTITSTGTIKINSTYQTYISHGNTAYGWGNHANAGYALASSLSDYLSLSGGNVTGFLWAAKGATDDYDTTSIKNSAAFAAGIKNSDSVFIGFKKNTAGFIQAAYYGTTEFPSSYYTYGLVLQPIGGNVGVGAVSNSYRFYVDGSIGAVNGFKYVGLNDNYVLLAGGSYKGLNDFAMVTDLSSYLPLSGGTLTGSLTLGTLYIKQSGGIYAEDVGSQARKIYGVDSSNDRYTRMAAYAILPDNDTNDAWQVRKYGGSYSDAIITCLQSGNVGIGTTTPSQLLEVNGVIKAKRISIGVQDDQINTTSGAGLHLQYGNTNGVSICANGGNVGIGTTTPQYNLHVNGSFYATSTSTQTAYVSSFLKVETGDTHNLSDDMHSAASMCIGEYEDDAIWIGRINTNSIGFIQCSYKNASAARYVLSLQPRGGNVGIQTTAPSYALHVAGDIYATGGVTALSDIRHKTIVEETRLQVSDIASMRAVRYIWDDGREDKGMHVGSIAQDWQKILPEVVLRANNDEGTLSLQYGVAALISSITIARKVVNHEQRITELERENADLKQAYSFIKNAYDYLKMDYENLKLKIA